MQAYVRKIQYISVIIINRTKFGFQKYFLGEDPGKLRISGLILYK